MNPCVLVMARNGTGPSFVWTGATDVRFGTRLEPIPARLAQDVACVTVRISARRPSIPSPVASIVAQALVILRNGLESIKALPGGSRRLWCDRTNGDRPATLEHLFLIARSGSEGAAAVAKSLEFCLAVTLACEGPRDIGPLLVELQRSNARLVAECIEHPSEHTTIRTVAIEVASIARRIAAATLTRGETAHA